MPGAHSAPSSGARGPASRCERPTATPRDGSAMFCHEIAARSGRYAGEAREARECCPSRSGWNMRVDTRTDVLLIRVLAHHRMSAVEHSFGAQAPEPAEAS